MYANKRVSIILGVLAISFASILWGFDGVVLTPRLQNKNGGYLNINYVVFILHFIPFLLMHFFLSKEYNKLKTFSRGDFIYLFLIALFGGAIGTISIVKALFLVQFNNLSIIVLLQKLQPVFGIILAAILLKEKIRKHFFFWAFVAIAASYFLTFGFGLPIADDQKTTLYAALYALLAAFSFGSSTVFSKKFLLKYDFKTATFFRYGFTVVIMLLIVLFNRNLSELSNTPPQTWGVFTIIAFTTGSGAIFLYYFGLKKVKAIISTLCELFFPVSAIIFDYIFNNNTLNTVQWISTAILMFAIFSLSSASTKTPKI